MRIISIDVETKDPYLKKYSSGARLGGKILCICAATSDGECYLDISKAKLQELIADYDWIIGSNIQYDLDYLDLDTAGKKICDVLATERLLDTVSMRVNLGTLAEKYLGKGKLTTELEIYAEANGIKRVMENLDKIPNHLLWKYCYVDCSLALDVFNMQYLLVKDMVGFDVEVGIQTVIREMRKQGVPFDVEKAKHLSEEMLLTINKLGNEIENKFGTTNFKTDEGKKVLAAYCDEQGVLFQMTAKTNKPQFDAKFFMKYTGQEALQMITKYHELCKLRTEFVDKLISVCVEGKIYPNINPMKGDAGGTITGRFSCVHPETKVLTTKGWKEIQHIRKGDSVLSHKGRECKVERLIRNGTQDIYNLDLSNGHVLTCTKSHKLLQSNGKWISLKTILKRGIENVSLKEAYTGQGAGEEDTEDVSSKGFEKDGGYSRGVRYNLPHGASRDNYADAQGRVRDTEEGKILCLKDGEQESDEREESRETSQLERRSCGSERIPNHNDIRRTHVRTQESNSGCARPAQATITAHSASHRWESFEQHPRQSCTVYQSRASQDTRKREATYREVKIKVANYSGRCEVFDITVADDHSYITAGVYSHNCSKPNLQQISSRNIEWSHRIRDLFTVAPGYKWVKLDYSAQEVRVFLSFAAGSGGREAEEFVTKFNEDPYLDPYLYAAEKAKAKGREIPRATMKMIILAMQYCMGVKRLAGVLNCSEDEARELLNTFNELFPFMRKFQREVLATVERRGKVQKEAFVTTLAGRKVYLPIDKLPVSVAGSTLAFVSKVRDTYKAINYLVQGSSADITKRAMLNVYDTLGIAPLVSIHDELGFAILETEIDSIVPKIISGMESTYNISIPMKVSCDVGYSWGEYTTYQTRDMAI